MPDDYDFDDDDDFDECEDENEGRREPRGRQRRERGEGRRAHRSRERRHRRPRELECPVCGEMLRAQATMCGNCGEQLRRRRRRGNREFSGVEKALLPVGRPVTAIAAGYCGLISILPMIGLPFQLAGITCGILALKSIKENPELLGVGRAWFGIIVGTLGLLASMLGFVTIAMKA